MNATRPHRSRPILTIGGLLLLCATPALAQPYDFDWVTIGDVGNPAYEGDRHGRLAGRGSVGYEYRIGRHEVTTAQWMEFLNTFSTRYEEMRYFGRPVRWGAGVDPDYDGEGVRYKLKNLESAEWLPVGGISWREAAMYCNWLHNGRTSDLGALADGAYDTSTFGYDGDGMFTDQRAHHPEARFWIPTLDEWLKAAHYDPDRHGEGEGGWWQYSITSDDPISYGPPGDGEANAGFELWEDAEWEIPLGAYPEIVSPWGLLDVAGGTAEWTEEVYNTERVLEGSGAGLDSYYADLQDQVSRFSTRSPEDAGHLGFRIVTVPSPGTAVLTLVCFMSLVPRHAGEEPGVVGRLRRRDPHPRHRRPHARRT